LEASVLAYLLLLLLLLNSAKRRGSRAVFKAHSRFRTKKWLFSHTAASLLPLLSCCCGCGLQRRAFCAAKQ
jgi:hypothetical protein